MTCFASSVGETMVSVAPLSKTSASTPAETVTTWFTFQFVPSKERELGSTDTDADPSVFATPRSPGRRDSPKDGR